MSARHHIRELILVTIVEQKIGYTFESHWDVFRCNNIHCYQLFVLVEDKIFLPRPPKVAIIRLESIF